ncbi:hypothetical protein CEP51_007763 [Fusarium floridanum]|uniref:Uncharacterized protein n=1 Tax=Fusarium floridanum TaxID=1325733 RepID=A0A428RN32_9HYPO|nr:hypothetical protein CEP51_007763 [Fusarium floridanum]
MPSRKKTSAASQPATPIVTPLRQTRARSRLNNAPHLMTGLDHRGRALDPVPTDPENIIFDDVVKELRNRRKKKIVFRQRGTTPESPTDNVKAAKRAQLEKKAPIVSPASPASSTHSRPPSPMPSDSDSDGGIPFYPPSPSSSSSDPDEDGDVPLHPESPSSNSSDPASDGGMRLNSPSPPSSSGYGSTNAAYGDSAAPLSRGSCWSSGSSRSRCSSHHSGASRRSDRSDSGPPGAGASAPLADDDLGWASQPPPSPPPPAVPHNTPDNDGSPHAPALGADEDTTIEDTIQAIRSLAPSPEDSSHGFEPRDGFASRPIASPIRKHRPEDLIIPEQVDGKLTAVSVDDEDEDESPRAATRRPRSGCADGSLRKRRRSEDDGSASQAMKKPRTEEEVSFARTISVPYDCVYESESESDISPLMLDHVEEEEEEEEEEDLYSPTYPIPVTEQSDIEPFPSLIPTTTKIPGLAFLETQNVSITPDNVSPKALTPIEAPADFDSEIPGIYGSGKRPRLDYDWYEQYHRMGSDCQKVHGCQHSQPCHQCHADWHKAWSHFFKRQDEIDAETAAMANYDIRKGYLGTALGFEHAPRPVITPIPPRGGKIRTHPARIAKEKLALMERLAKEG